MRIATSTIYSDQTNSIDSLSAQYQQYGQELSTGKSLNEPSDNPVLISQDLSVRNDSAVTGAVTQNLTNVNNLLTTTDSTLSSLTGILQSARNLAIEGAQDSIDGSQRAQIGQQINQLLQETIGLANTQYDGKYIFAGSKIPAGTQLVQAVGNPPTSVVAQNNLVQQTQELPDGQTVPTNVTLQQAFNVGSANGSPSVFDMLIRLRDTLENGSVVNESASQINVPGQAVLPTSTITQLTATAPPVLATPVTLDSGGAVSFSIISSTAPNGVNIVCQPASTVAQIVTAINADTAQTGVVAAFNYQSQRLSLTDSNNQNFLVENVPTVPGGTTANFTNAFALASTSDVVTNLSTQLGDIDTTLTAALSAAGEIGATVQAVAGLSSTESSRSTQDTQSQSNIEDTDIPKVTTEFSLTQTALQAAYSTTTRLEQGDLFTYLQ